MHYEACKEMFEAYKNDSEDWEKDFDDCDFGNCNLFKNKADFVEVKHGKWVYWQPNGTNHLWVCSVCNCAIVTPMPFVAKHIAFCEHCGADMRKEGVDNG